MRPSLASQRSAEMLDALADCVAEYGVQGVTVDKIAARAGWTRGLVRHYLGNKDEQLRALISVLSTRYATELIDAIAAAPVGQRRRVVIDVLFGARWQQRDRDDIVLDQLIAYEALKPANESSLLVMYRSVADTIASATLSERPDLDAQAAAELGFTVVSLAYGSATMLGIGWPEQTRTAAAVAQELLFAGEGEAGRA
ncbi:TetR/AcrR family transcriptional regulator [Streptomyces sp. NBC_00846]|uniref:TetR/AcrR family transcriptional regulator n=1 Tax=Streptomyces sp. NBC_00846 TaxID=2975849 RepID=UPI00386BC8E5|nr:TetR/AcrR family transcriptional regulator [Streptomyces sp. NBC_00846]